MVSLKCKSKFEGYNCSVITWTDPLKLDFPKSTSTRSSHIPQVDRVKNTTAQSILKEIQKIILVDFCCFKHFPKKLKLNNKLVRGRSNSKLTKECLQLIREILTVWRFWLTPSLAQVQLWPDTHFCLVNTSAKKILWPGTYFGPETLWPETTLDQKQLRPNILWPTTL